MPSPSSGYNKRSALIALEDAVIELLDEGESEEDVIDYVKGFIRDNEVDTDG